MMALADGDSGDSRRRWWRLQVVVALTGGGAGKRRLWRWQVVATVEAVTIVKLA